MNLQLTNANISYNSKRIKLSNLKTQSYKKTIIIELTLNVSAI